MSNLELDCGDNSCLFAKSKGGMRTNGGCRCLSNAGFSKSAHGALREMLPEVLRLRAEAKATSLILDKANSGLDDVERIILTLTKERDEAREWVRKMVRDTQTLTCVYCGHAYPPGTPTHGSEVLTAHIEVCEKHPARKIREERDTLRAQLAAKDAEIERLREQVGCIGRLRRCSQGAAASIQEAYDELQQRLSELEPVAEAVREMQEATADCEHEDSSTWERRYYRRQRARERVCALKIPQPERFHGTGGGR